MSSVLMDATATLLFCRLATSVLAFLPIVELGKGKNRGGASDLDLIRSLSTMHSPDLSTRCSRAPAPWHRQRRKMHCFLF